MTPLAPPIVAHPIAATSLPGRQPSLNLLDIALQTLSVLMLVVAIVAVQARIPCHLYLVAAPILPIALWACAGLVIDRQTLRGLEANSQAAGRRG